ncbi:hypothetical protein [Streptomyces sp. NPDC058751]|uniref:hypothetical protein n=1 Tax=Streptomyces sp. NPDC058751 TaxID=3346623 RepID=UPI0036D15851
MTLPKNGLTTIQIAPIGTPLHARPGTWADLGTVNDFQIHYVDEALSFVPLPALAPTAIGVELGSLAFSALLAQLRAFRHPHPACSDTRQRIEEHLRHRRLTNMLQAALHSYRPTPLALPLVSLANPV